MAKSKDTQLENGMILTCVSSQYGLIFPIPKSVFRTPYWKKRRRNSWVDNRSHVTVAKYLSQACAEEQPNQPLAFCCCSKGNVERRKTLFHQIHSTVIILPHSVHPSSIPLLSHTRAENFTSSFICHLALSIVNSPSRVISQLPSKTVPLACRRS